MKNGNLRRIYKPEIKIGKIISAEKVESADKLLKLEVDFGDETRQIVTGITQWFQPKDLIGKQVPVLTNLEPRTFRGFESQGMILATGTDQKPVLIIPEEEVLLGSKIK